MTDVDEPGSLSFVEFNQPTKLAQAELAGVTCIHLSSRPEEFATHQAERDYLHGLYTCSDNTHGILQHLEMWRGKVEHTMLLQFSITNEQWNPTKSKHIEMLLISMGKRVRPYCVSHRNQ